MVIYARNYAPGLHPREMLARPMEFLSAAEQKEILSAICADVKQKFEQYAKDWMGVKLRQDMIFQSLAFESIWAAEELEMDLEIAVSEALTGVIILRNMDSDLRPCLHGKCRRILKKLLQNAMYASTNPEEGTVEIRFFFDLREKNRV